MKKTLFFSLILMGVAFCYAQDVSTLSAFRDTIKKSTDGKTYNLCEIGKRNQLDEIGDDCLYGLSLDLDAAIDKRYKDLQAKNKQNKLKPKLPQNYFSKLKEKYNAYKEKACFNPLVEETGGMKTAYESTYLVCYIEQKLFQLKTLERFDKEIF